MRRRSKLRIAAAVLAGVLAGLVSMTVMAVLAAELGLPFGAYVQRGIAVAAGAAAAYSLL